jgi:protein-disulfide isomerase
MQLKKMIKNKDSSKLLFLVKIFFILFIFSFNPFVGDGKTEEGLIVLGKDNAPVKVKIFSSHTCPHCANFHTKIVPLLEKKYISSGKVQLIFIDFPLDEAALNASKILHCLDAKKQIKFLDYIYEKQSSWTSGSDIKEINKNLEQIVKTFDITSEKFELCLNDKNNEDFILKSRIENQQKYSISATPTIVINEKKFKGSLSFENLEKKIDKLI